MPQHGRPKGFSRGWPKGFCQGGPNSGDILFNQLETNRRTQK